MPRLIITTTSWLPNKIRTVGGLSGLPITSNGTNTPSLTGELANSRPSCSFTHSLGFLQNGSQNNFLFNPDTNQLSTNNRSIEKLIEEAYLCGALQLNGKKLTEFPDCFISKYDISDLVIVDLSNNRFNELPIIITKLQFLETLILANNVICLLPKNMDGLKCLKYLDLSSNNLTALPCSLFQLPLEVLNVSNNKLDTLSGDIVQTGETLQELDLSRNKLTSITTSISLLKQLRVLNLMCNKLDALPSEIVSLELYTLNVTGNRLTDLPVELCSMSSLIHLYVNDNPLQSPPIEIAMKGREHIFKYLQSAVSSDVNYRGNYTDWSTNRNSFINATIRRPKNAERLAAKAKRFAALNSSDSGYTSTGDDQRHSFELQLSRNSLESIDEGGKIKSPICRNKREIPKSGSLGTISNEDEGVALTPHLPKDLKRDLSLLDEVLKTYEEMAEQSKDIKNNNFKLKEVEMNVNEEKDIKNNNMVESNEMEASMYTKLACVYITESTIIEGSSIIVTDKPPKSPAKEIVIEKAPIESAEVTLSSKENEKSLLDCGNCVLVDSSNISTKTTPGIVAPASRLMRPSAGMSKLAPPSPSKSTLLVKKDSVSPKLIKPTPIITSRLPKVSSTRTSSSVSSRSSTPNSSANTSNSSNSHENSSDSSIEVMSKILSPKGNSNGKGDISSTLASGVLLCNFVNKLKPRSITVMSSISPSQPLPLPKAKKNAENFVNSAKKLGVSEINLCSPGDIVDKKNIAKIAQTVIALNRIFKQEDGNQNLGRKVTHIA